MFNKNLICRRIYLSDKPMTFSGSSQHQANGSAKSNSDYEKLKQMGKKAIENMEKRSKSANEHNKDNKNFMIRLKCHKKMDKRKK